MGGTSGHAGFLLRLSALLLACAAARAQDGRPVVEPRLPPACAVLVADRIDAEAPPATADDTARIQAAIDHCDRGASVRLAAANEDRAFLAGPLTLASGVTLVVERGATLYASRDPAHYDRGAGTCGRTDATGHGCRPFINVVDTTGSGIMGEGAIDGQGGQPLVGSGESWWQLARRAQREHSEHNIPRLIEVDASREFTLHGITLRNAPNFHVMLNQVDGFTAWGVRIDTPATARNTDGIDPLSSRNVTITHSFIRTGDDDVALKAGDAGPTENVSIVDNHFYSGHGMSIGSETQGGVRHVLVQGLSLDGTVSGLRIKSDVSRGGHVQDVRYRDICLRDVRAPIDVSTDYARDARGTRVPVYDGLVFEDVRSLTPGRVIVEGHDADHPVRARFIQVQVDGGTSLQIANAALEPAASFIGGGPAPDCAQRFPAFPDAAPEPASMRPQLSDGQARHYAYAQVLGQAGPPGQERADPWDPLAERGLPANPDYTVDPRAADGRRVFATVQAAVNQAVVDARQAGAKPRLAIFVTPGVYRELVYVPPSASAITLYGTPGDATATVITTSLDASVSGADYARRYGAQFAGTDPAIQAMAESLKRRATLGTFGSYTVWVRNRGFQAFDLTMANAYRREAVPACVDDCRTAAAPQPHQAVALAVDGADRAQFANVRLLGLQDTLYLNDQDDGRTARSFFDHAYIEGDVDFIFGDATAFFSHSEIRSLGGRRDSYVGAPDTNLRSAYGFVFDHCTFSSDDSAWARAGVYRLARQWFHDQKCTPYGAMAVPGYACDVGPENRFDGVRGQISKPVIETVGKMVVLHSRLGPHISRTHPWADWNQDGKLSYRPVQLDSDDYWAHLLAAGIDPIGQLGYPAKPAPPAVFLAEYHDTDD